MRTLTILLTALTCLFICTPSTAETRTHPIGVEITFPDAWEAEIGEDDLLMHESDESAAVLVRVAEADDVEAAVEEVMDELEEWIAGAEVTTESRDGKLNGIPVTFVEGIGTLDGEPANWLVAFFMHRGKVVMIAGWAETEEWDPEKGDVVDIMSSVETR